MENSEKTKILFLSANPESIHRLDPEKELKEITGKIRSSTHRNSFEIISEWAVSSKDLIDHLNEHKPHIVHFSGHGVENKLVLLNERGELETVSGEFIQSLFTTCKDNIRLVVFSTCDSSSMAKKVSEVIDCSIGMNVKIRDNSATMFCGVFYKAIGYGRSVQEAFVQAKLSLQGKDEGESTIPDIFCKSNVESTDIRFVDDTTETPNDSEGPEEPPIIEGIFILLIFLNLIGITFWLWTLPDGELNKLYVFIQWLATVGGYFGIKLVFKKKDIKLIKLPATRLCIIAASIIVGFLIFKNDDPIPNDPINPQQDSVTFVLSLNGHEEDCRVLINNKLANNILRKDSKNLIIKVEKSGQYDTVKVQFNYYIWIDTLNFTSDNFPDTVLIDKPYFYINCPNQNNTVFTDGQPARILSGQNSRLKRIEVENINQDYLITVRNNNQIIRNQQVTISSEKYPDTIWVPFPKYKVRLRITPQMVNSTCYVNDVIVPTEVLNNFNLQILIRATNSNNFNIRLVNGPRSKSSGLIHITGNRTINLMN